MQTQIDEVYAISIYSKKKSRWRGRERKGQGSNMLNELSQA